MEHSAPVITFGPFRLIPNKRELWKDDVLLKVRLMPLMMLAYLVQHPGRVVPAEELHRAVWGNTHVSRTTIRVCMRELRRALGDEAGTPRYIETVGRQGYRFIGGAGGWGLETSPPSPQVPSLKPPVSNFVGRQQELQQLQQWFAQAQQGQRQVVLVSGEP